MKAERAELASLLTTLFVVMGAVVATLIVADAIPRWLGAEPGGVMHVSGIDEAQRRLREHLYLPPYFPDSLAWPPSRVEVLTGPQAALALSITARGGGPEVLRLVELLDPVQDPAVELWPPVTRLGSTTVSLDDIGEGTLWRVLDGDGSFGHELIFEAKGRRFALRSRGSIEDLLRMARSLEHAR